jgi:hypothetical protein
LAGKAIDDVLLKSHADLYGVDGIRLLLELLLRTGRAQEARELLDREELRRSPNGLGFFDLPVEIPGNRRWAYRLPAYDWFELCQRAAAGNYDHASMALQRLRQRLQQERETAETQLRPVLAFRLASEIGFGSIPVPAMANLVERPEREQTAAVLELSYFLPIERADLFVVEGMLLLERGRPAAAREQFENSLPLYRRAESAVPALPGQFLALRFLALIPPRNQ